jgi:hypothetical protein
MCPLSQQRDNMRPDWYRKHALLFTAALLCAPKLAAQYSDRPSPAKLATVETAIDQAKFILERIDKRWAEASDGKDASCFRDLVWKQAHRADRGEFFVAAGWFLTRGLNFHPVRSASRQYFRTNCTVFIRTVRPPHKLRSGTPSALCLFVQRARNFSFKESTHYDNRKEEPDQQPEDHQKGQRRQHAGKEWWFIDAEGFAQQAHGRRQVEMAEIRQDGPKAVNLSLTTGASVSGNKLQKGLPDGGLFFFWAMIGHSLLTRVHASGSESQLIETIDSDRPKSCDKLSRRSNPGGRNDRRIQHLSLDSRLRGSRQFDSYRQNSQ